MGCAVKSYSIWRSVLMGSLQCRGYPASIKPFDVRKLWMTRSQSWSRAASSKAEPSKPTYNTDLGLGSQGQTAPEKFDGGDYDEEKNEEYEQEAERRAQRIRRLKKILSSALFVSVLGYVGYARRSQRAEVASNIENAKLLNDDGCFKGSVKVYCVYAPPNAPSAKVVLPFSIIKDGTMKRIANMKIRDDDIIVASFPKSGTTWIQEIVYCINNDLDFDEAQRQVLEVRFPFLEFPFPGLSAIEKMPAPRMIKTHLPYDFLPLNSEKAKVIYITRNPKDALVSYYHFLKMAALYSFTGTFRDFLDKFEKNELPYCPFFDHVESYVKRQNDPNLLILTYEELSKDPTEVIKKIGSFLGKSLSEEDVQKLVKHTSFQKMAANSSVNYEHWNDLGLVNKGEAKFMRKGKVGDWKNTLSKTDNDQLDQWIEQNNTIKFPFVYEI